MPYASNHDLPASVRNHLPPHAQDIYREAFNHTFESHVGEQNVEARSHRVAWAAVKYNYEKVDNQWIARER